MLAEIYFYKYKHNSWQKNLIFKFKFSLLIFAK